MIINDRIYNKIIIKSKVIEDLILSKPMQRLKKISQDGAPHFIQPIRNVNRFEHSVGVWYLSSIFNRPIEEQIACLLHDIPHTAFSHVIDFVFPSEAHDFHEKFTERIILESEIPLILKKHKISLEKVLDLEKFPLLENNLPDISFDRWDYFMRDGFMMKFIPSVLIDEFLTKMQLHKNTLYFNDIHTASTFAILFISFSRLIWLDPTSHGSFFLIAEAIKIALNEKIISTEDFFTNDEKLLKKLKTSNNLQIKRLLSRLVTNKEFIYTTKEEAEFFGPNKPRFVDPIVKTGGKFVRLSEIVPSFGYYTQEFKEKYKNLGVKQL